MNAVRSVLFNVVFVAGSLILSLALLWICFLPEQKRVAVIAAIYLGFLKLTTRWIMGLKLEVRGLENLPPHGQYILAAKHHSWGDGYVMFANVDKVAFVTGVCVSRCWFGNPTRGEGSSTAGDLDGLIGGVRGLPTASSGATVARRGSEHCCPRAYWREENNQRATVANLSPL